MEGSHQRLWEILASGVTPLTRKTIRNITNHNLTSALFKIAPNNLEHNTSPSDLTDQEQQQLNDLVFSQAQNILSKNPDISLDHLKQKVEKQISKRVTTNQRLPTNHFNDIDFCSKNKLTDILSNRIAA
ncbi:MAG: hypothetical protein DRP42_06100 [Tenericutes bacterium]|nr:MAG: hypothetical protein DRP42_06100 [Mycoplasmatota bacterium]